jgi:acyl-coenzyme A thioesterase PaaI-like protein
MGLGFVGLKHGMNKSPLLYRHPRLFRWALTWFPPYWGTGIRVAEVARDFSRIVVEMRATVLNRNAFGTHFGGSLYAMSDPFYCLMLVARLGPNYVVWDQAARIEFVKPGRGKVQAVFVWSNAQVEAIRQQAQSGQKVLPERELLITDESGEVVARVHKTLYVREKKRA